MRTRNSNVLITEFSFAVTEVKIHAKVEGVCLSRISMDASYNLILDKIGG